jgi:hypothetical protein
VCKDILVAFLSVCGLVCELNIKRKRTEDDYARCRAIFVDGSVRERILFL